MRFQTWNIGVNSVYQLKAFTSFVFFLIQDFRHFPQTTNWVLIIAHYFRFLNSCLADFYQPMVFWNMWNFNLADC